MVFRLHYSKSSAVCAHPICSHALSLRPSYLLVANPLDFQNSSVSPYIMHESILPILGSMPFTKMRSMALTYDQQTFTNSHCTRFLQRGSTSDAGRPIIANKHNRSSISHLTLHSPHAVSVRCMRLLHLDPNPR